MLLWDLESAPLHVDQVLILQRYLAEPDHTLHQNGFYNGELRKKLADLDATFHYALKKIETDEQLASRLNIILTADHGHAEVSIASAQRCYVWWGVEAEGNYRKSSDEHICKRCPLLHTWVICIRGQPRAYVILFSLFCAILSWWTSQQLREMVWVRGGLKRWMSEVVNACPY